MFHSLYLVTIILQRLNDILEISYHYGQINFALLTMFPSHGSLRIPLCNRLYIDHQFPRH